MEGRKRVLEKYRTQLKEIDSKERLRTTNLRNAVKVA
jgi:hypothetical protein